MDCRVHAEKDCHLDGTGAVQPAVGVPPKAGAGFRVVYGNRDHPNPRRPLQGVEMRVQAVQRGIRGRSSAGKDVSGHGIPFVICASPMPSLRPAGWFAESASGRRYTPIMPDLSYEIERKYLLRGRPPRTVDAPSLEIDQGYIPGERIKERIRRASDGSGTRYYRTIRSAREFSGSRSRRKRPPISSTRCGLSPPDVAYESAATMWRTAASFGRSTSSSTARRCGSPSWSWSTPTKWLRFRHGSRRSWSGK